MEQEMVAGMKVFYQGIEEVEVEGVSGDWISVRFSGNRLNRTVFRKELTSQFQLTFSKYGELGSIFRPVDMLIQAYKSFCDESLSRQKEHDISEMLRELDSQSEMQTIVRLAMTELLYTLFGVRGITGRQFIYRPQLTYATPEQLDGEIIAIRKHYREEQLRELLMVTEEQSSFRAYLTSLGRNCYAGFVPHLTTGQDLFFMNIANRDLPDPISLFIQRKLYRTVKFFEGWMLELDNGDIVFEVKYALRFLWRLACHKTGAVTVSDCLAVLDELHDELWAHAFKHNALYYDRDNDLFLGYAKILFSSENPVSLKPKFPEMDVYRNEFEKAVLQVFIALSSSHVPLSPFLDVPEFQKLEQYAAKFSGERIPLEEAMAQCLFWKALDSFGSLYEGILTVLRICSFFGTGPDDGIEVLAIAHSYYEKRSLEKSKRLCELLIDRENRWSSFHSS